MGTANVSNEFHARGEMHARFPCGNFPYSGKVSSPLHPEMLALQLFAGGKLTRIAVEDYAAIGKHDSARANL